MPDFMSDIFSFLMYLTGFLAFTILFMMSFGGCDKFESQSQTILATWNAGIAEEQFLLNYLRTDITIDGRETNFAELIAESCLNDNYETIKEETKKFMGSGVERAVQVKLSVNCNPEKSKVVDFYEYKAPDGCYYIQECSSAADSGINIPLGHDGEDFRYAMVKQTSCGYYEYVTTLSVAESGGSTQTKSPVYPSDEELLAKGCIR